MDGAGSFWVLQWKDGTFYMKGKADGWDTVESTDDPLSAERFEDAEDAKRFHDCAGHFYHQPMKTVRVVAVLDDASTVELPALKRSRYRREDD